MFKGIKQRFIITSNHLYNHHIHHLSGFYFNKLKVAEKKKIDRALCSFLPYKIQPQTDAPIICIFKPWKFPRPPRLRLLVAVQGAGGHEDPTQDIPRQLCR